MKIESMRHKVSQVRSTCLPLSNADTPRRQLDQVKDENLVYRSTLERRTMYKSMRMAEPRYVSAPTAERRTS